MIFLQKPIDILSNVWYNSINENKGAKTHMIIDTKIDRRKHYIMVLDTETANSIIDERGKLDFSSVLVYDIGYQIIDTHGNVYEKNSFVNRDIFYHEQELMNSAYYADKIPLYKEQIKNKTRQVASTYDIRQAMLKSIEFYNIKEVCAHNMRFDLTALNNTMRWTTKSKFRYWFPYDIELWDSMNMARDVILKMPTYKKFCETHDLFTSTGRLSCTAENLYKFITNNPEFKESHTGLEDVEIESKIIAYCYRQHKKMRKELFKKEA